MGHYFENYFEAFRDVPPEPDSPVADSELPFTLPGSERTDIAVVFIYIQVKGFRNPPLHRLVRSTYLCEQCTLLKHTILEARDVPQRVSRSVRGMERQVNLLCRKGVGDVMRNMTR